MCLSLYPVADRTSSMCERGIYISTGKQIRAYKQSLTQYNENQQYRVEGQIWSSRLRKAKQRNHMRRDYLFFQDKMDHSRINHSKYTDQEMTKSRYLKNKTSSKSVQDWLRQEDWRPWS